jgi:hypothetical protein
MCCCHIDLKHDNTVKYILNFKEKKNEIYNDRKEFLSQE